MIQALTERESGAINASVLVQVQKDKNNDIKHFILTKKLGTQEGREAHEKLRCSHTSAKKEK